MFTSRTTTLVALVKVVLYISALLCAVVILFQLLISCPVLLFFDLPNHESMYSCQISDSTPPSLLTDTSQYLPFSYNYHVASFVRVRTDLIMLLYILALCLFEGETESYCSVNTSCMLLSLLVILFHFLDTLPRYFSFQLLLLIQSSLSSSKCYISHARYIELKSKYL